jgi:hypothetical protein
VDLCACQLLLDDGQTSLTPVSVGQPRAARGTVARWRGDGGSEGFRRLDQQGRRGGTAADQADWGVRGRAGWQGGPARRVRYQESPYRAEGARRPSGTHGPHGQAGRGAVGSPTARRRGRQRGHARQPAASDVRRGDHRRRPGRLPPGDRSGGRDRSRRGGRAGGGGGGQAGLGPGGPGGRGRRRGAGPSGNRVGARGRARGRLGWGGGAGGRARPAARSGGGLAGGLRGGGPPPSADGGSRRGHRRPARRAGPPGRDACLSPPRRAWRGARQLRAAPRWPGGGVGGRSRTGDRADSSRGAARQRHGGGNGVESASSRRR